MSSCCKKLWIWQNIRISINHLWFTKSNNKLDNIWLTAVIWSRSIFCKFCIFFKDSMKRNRMIATVNRQNFNMVIICQHFLFKIIFARMFNNVGILEQYSDFKNKQSTDENLRAQKRLECVLWIIYGQCIRSQIKRQI